MRKSKFIKCYIIIIIILFIGSVNVTSIAKINEPKDAIFYRNNLYVGGSGPGNYSKIQDAIVNAGDGDTIYVYDDSSPYTENIFIDKSVNIIGEDRDTTVINGNTEVVRFFTDWASITGFTIKGGYYGIYLRDSSSNNTITGNTISNNDYGFFVIQSSDNNIFSENNIMNNNRWGMYVSNSSKNNISKNIITNNDENGIEITYSANNNIISGNTITNNKEYGIYLFDSSNNTITGNIITSNEYAGIELDTYCDNNIIKGNTISKNGWSIGLLNSYFNNIEYNNFLRNKFNQHANFVYDPLYLLYSNYWNENYWTRPRILPKPVFGIVVIGLIPFLWINFDWNPAQEPYDV